MVPLAAGSLIPPPAGAGLAFVHGLAGVIVVLFMPGYAISRAAFPTQTVGFWERVMLSLGLSIAVAAFSGLVLTWTPFGLRVTTWLAALGMVTLAATLFALWRREGAEEAPSPSLTPSPAPPHEGEGRGQGEAIPVRVPLLIGLAMLIAVGAIAVAYVGVINEVQPGYTELWLLPDAATGAHAVRVGIKNMELSPVRYHLVVELANQKVADWSPIELQPGQSWQTTADLATPPKEGAPVQAFLYKLDAPQTVYRWTRLAQAPGVGSGT